MSQANSQWHFFCRFVGRKSKHHALIARSNFAVSALHTLANVTALLVQRVKYGTRIGIKTHAQIGVTNVSDGFSSDALKIDGSFVRGVVMDRDDAAIVQAIIGLAKNLDLRVIAEGLETPEQMAFLTSHGCEEAQGYLISRPLAPEDFAAQFLGPAVVKS